MAEFLELGTHIFLHCWRLLLPSVWDCLIINSFHPKDEVTEQRSGMLDLAIPALADTSGLGTLF